MKFAPSLKSWDSGEGAIESSPGELGTEHGQAAYRTGLCRFILDKIPVLG
jgi:hypothetical protein